MRPAELDRVTVAEAADRYVELVRAKTLTGALSPATAEVYARDVATLVELAGERVVLDDLTGADVDAILLAFARKPDGRRGGLRAERRALTREQAQGLIGAAQALPEAPAQAGKRRDQRTELRDAVIVLLLATVGPRVSELVRANVEDFFTNDGVRYWRIFGKGGRTRDVPLPDGVARVLQAYLERGRPEMAGAGGEKALLLSWRGRRLARGDVQAVIDRVQRRVDPDQRRSVTPHGLRHTTATHLLADAVDMDAVRRVLGHSDLSTLGRYRDELPGELEVAMRSHPLLRGRP
uniref:Tyrosine recombinase XerC n=1 Tax=Nonomuraea gerenzanensis TaxID=93944 RepID=A0A1M4EC87_9ACTN|nr:tyrosine-type recombinase/integrase [Nonomuraea gerenzanensis]SBO96509.1 tyrosine recombinase XerC [Nonomuraea gerenzanensis]